MTGNDNTGSLIVPNLSDKALFDRDAHLSRLFELVEKLPDDLDSTVVYALKRELSYLKKLAPQLVVGTQYRNEEDETGSSYYFLIPKGKRFSIEDFRSGLAHPTDALELDRVEWIVP